MKNANSAPDRRSTMKPRTSSTSSKSGNQSAEQPDLVITIKAIDRATRDRDLEAAERVAIAHAVAHKTRGVLILRHSPELFTVQLSDEVPYGQTRERNLQSQS